MDAIKESMSMKQKPKHCKAWGVFTKGGRLVQAHKSKLCAMAFAKSRHQKQTVKKVKVSWP